MRSTMRDNYSLECALKVVANGRVEIHQKIKEAEPKQAELNGMDKSRTGCLNVIQVDSRSSAVSLTTKRTTAL